MLNIYRIDHIGQVVPDLEKQVALMEGLFGFRRARTWENAAQGCRGALLDVPGSWGQRREVLAPLGINTTRIKVLTFAISAIFMGAAGVVLAPSLSYSNASIAFSVTYSFIPIVVAVFGGMGSLPGPVIGALVFGFLEKTL
ncbi:MAG: hypothetical protein JSU71_00895, partial [Betaproteobacteria bacterium]